MRARPQKQDEHRINEQIRVPQIRLIDENGEQAGIVPTARALQRAIDVGLDLVEIAGNAEPPVCKIMDYGKFRFETQKKAQAARKNQQTIVVKEITLRPRTEEHDYQVKLKKIREFLEKGNKVKVTVRFRGREMAHQEMGAEQLMRICTDLGDVGKSEGNPRTEGRQMHVMLSPAKK